MNDELFNTSIENSRFWCMFNMERTLEQLARNEMNFVGIYGNVIDI